MSIEQGLLRAVVEEPDDDTHRLVYADWLEEQGDPRSEFIRVQIALSKMDEWDERHPALLDRSRELSPVYAEQIAGALGALGVEQFEFSRGFVETVSLTVQAFHTHAEALFSLAPITGLRPTNLNGSLQQLVDSLWLARLRRLNLTGAMVRDAGLLALLESPHSARLRILELAENDISARGAALFSGRTYLPDLKVLDLRYNPIADAGMEALAESPTLSGLTILNAGAAPEFHYSQMLRAGGATAIASSPYLTALRKLILSDNQIGDAGLLSLAASGNLEHLQFLDLSANGIGEIGDAGMDGLAASSHLNGLRVLILMNNSFGVGGGIALASWPGLGSLIRLDVKGCEIRDPGVSALARTPRSAGLRELDLSQNRIGDRGVDLLIQSPHLSPSLRLNLQGNNFSRRFYRPLADRFPHVNLD